MSGRILSATELHQSAARATGAPAGVLLSMGYLHELAGQPCAAHLLSEWRIGENGALETTVPFRMACLTLSTGSLLAQSSISAKDLGLVAGRRLPNGLDEYLPASAASRRKDALAFVLEHTAAVWERYLARQPLTREDVELVRKYTKARIDGLPVRDHIYQEALHPPYHAWLDTVL